MKLPGPKEQDEALVEHVETVHFFDEESQELWEPASPPPTHDPAGDEDAAS